MHINGIDLSYVEWPGKPDAPTVLMLHATGFHARCWDATIEALPAQLRVIAVDQRGHGDTGGKVPVESWSQFSDDAAALIDRLALRDIIGVGHSMGGHSVTSTALKRSEAFRSLVLVDPVFPEPHVYEFNRYAGLAGPHEHPIAQRRDRWSSWQEMAKAFANRHPYKLWQRRVLDDYCRYGLLPAPDGDGFVLACPPVVEASVYMRSREGRMLDKLGGVKAPVTILRAKYTRLKPGLKMDFALSATWEGLAQLFGNAHDVYLPELTHFIPMQAPELVARHVAKAVESARSAAAR